MDLVTHTKEVWLHPRVPAAGVVTEVNTSFKQLAECEIWHRHGAYPTLSG
ncbi:hypothetical protein AmDm5_3012 [Acetobacter malorum]|nr:hypothetical protein AmDm5_3012 [Acetobacter malorum]